MLHFYFQIQLLQGFSHFGFLYIDPCPKRRILKFSIWFRNLLSFEEVRRSLIASPFTKPFLTPGGWQDLKWVYWNFSVGLKCVVTSKMPVSSNRLPLWIVVSKKVASESEISAVNLIVGWDWFAFLMNFNKLATYFTHLFPVPLPFVILSVTP